MTVMKESAEEKPFRVQYAPELLATGGVAALGLIAAAWNSFVGVRWEASSAFVLIPSGLLLPGLALAARLGRLRALTEILFYLVIYFTFTFFFVQMTYLCFAIGLPLQDKILAKIDLSFGFSWIDWAHYLSAHKSLLDLLNWSYSSSVWQPLVLIPLLALFRPRTGNWILFASLFIATIFTLVLTTFVPAIGRADTLGFAAIEPGPIIRALRTPGAAPILPYAGIVFFPSFHTVMAIAFTYAARNVPVIFPLSATLNVVMLASIPFSGDHYIADMLGGALVAGFSLPLSVAVASRIFPGKRR
jgi:hypothetical protein